MATQPPPRKGTYYKHIQVLHKDQHRSIQSKHNQEMLLLESIKGFFKQRFALEKQHFEALSKICSSQYRAFDCIKKLPVKDPELNNEVSGVKTMQTMQFLIRCNMLTFGSLAVSIRVCIK